MNDIESSTSEPFHDEQYFEEDNAFAQDVTLDQSLVNKVNRAELNLDPNDIFKSESLSIGKLFKKRTNHIITCVSTREYPLEIKDTSGLIEIPLFNRQEIDNKLSKLKTEVRKTISYLHIGMIKVMIKSTFRTGIDTPIKLAILDRRMPKPSDAIFGGIQGNLTYGKLMFSCSPKIGVSLADKNINQILCLAHEFERTDLMTEGNHPYTITYMLGYSLTNSHHSMRYRTLDTIKIEDIFKEVGRISHVAMQETTPLENSWSMDLSRKRLLGEPNRLTIKDSNDQRQITTTNNERRILPRNYQLGRTHSSRRFNGEPPAILEHARNLQAQIQELSEELGEDLYQVE